MNQCSSIIYANDGNFMQFDTELQYSLRGMFQSSSSWKKTI